MPNKARRVQRELTPEERKRLAKNVALVEQDKAELQAIGQELQRQQREIVAGILQELTDAKAAEGLSLADLMERTGMDRSSLSRLLNSEGNPTLGTLQRVASAMGRRLSITLQKTE